MHNTIYIIYIYSFPHLGKTTSSDLTAPSAPRDRLRPHDDIGQKGWQAATPSSP